MTMRYSSETGFQVKGLSAGSKKKQAPQMSQRNKPQRQVTKKKL